jgi:RNA polymerase sigma-70 factor, ECF subfamily
LDIMPGRRDDFDRSSISAGHGESNMSTAVQPFHSLTAQGQERFEHEVLPHLDRVYAGALRLTGGDRSAAEALAERTFERAFRDFHWARPASGVPAWLYQHLVSTWFEQEPYVRAPRGAALAGAAPAAGGLPCGPGVRDAVDEVVREAMDTLAPIVRLTLYLADAEGCTKHEIARITEVPTGIVEARIQRAHGRLAGRLTRWLSG